MAALTGAFVARIDGEDTNGQLSALIPQVYQGTRVPLDMWAGTRPGLGEQGFVVFVNGDPTWPVWLGTQFLRPDDGGNSGGSGALEVWVGDNPPDGADYDLWYDTDEVNPAVTGPIWAKGATGARGPTGSRGPAGPAGTPGAASTVAGPPGVNGARGFTGPQGAQGPKGDKGDPGTPGGPQGPKGDKGDPGATGALLGDTIDTNEPYRIIMYSNGTTRAIPVDATAPAVPTGLAAVAGVNSVKLTWTAVSDATQYILYRNSTQLAIVDNLTLYRDNTVVVGDTYTYSIAAANTYGLRSAHSADVIAFIDPALNSAPTVTVTTYPSGTIALGSKVIVRVNAYDIDAQILAKTLGTDVGSLVATADPTVWILEPA